MINVSLHTEEMNRINGFVRALAAKQAQKNSRDRLNGDTGSHRLAQNIVGKVGELAATKVVGGEVDFTVWVAGSRGAHFDADIVSTPKARKKGLFADAVVHVKTAHAKYAKDTAKLSWTIDRNDPLVEDCDGTEVIVLMVADETGKAAAFGWVYAADVADLWKPTINLAHKLAIYYNDVKSLVNKF